MAASHRIAQLIASLEKQGLDTFVGVTDGFHNFLDCDPVVTLTGFRPMGPCAVVLRTSGDLWLLVSPAWDAKRARERAPHCQVLEAGDVCDGLHALLRDLGPRGLGTAFAQSLPASTMDRLQDLPCTSRMAADDLVLQAGATKTPDELADVLEATRIAELGYTRMLEILRPGIREYELAGDLLHYMKSLGSHDNFFLMSASQHNQAVRPPSRRVLERGDILLAEITPALNNQFTQICRTVVLGPPAPLLAERFATLQAAMAAGQLAARAGARVSDSARAMNAVIAAAGFGAYCRPPYMRVRGHGFGNISHVPGDIGEDNDTVLREGMVFVMHPNQYFPDVGYLLCGEPVVVAADGAPALSGSPAQLDSVAA